MVVTLDQGSGSVGREKQMDIVENYLGNQEEKALGMSWMLNRKKGEK